MIFKILELSRGISKLHQLWLGKSYGSVSELKRLQHFFFRSAECAKKTNKTKKKQQKILTLSNENFVFLTYSNNSYNSGFAPYDGGSG